MIFSIIHDIDRLIPKINMKCNMQLSVIDCNGICLMKNECNSQIPIEYLPIKIRYLVNIELCIGFCMKERMKQGISRNSISLKPVLILINRQIKTIDK